ncbi:MAG: hypothetical protein AUH07_03235 [Gemmatimonadetes bacterium 13_2_20CM_70_9]|nr:MAG: hypothetical protein AUH07_03235 [Gemmatimonadetes bacterium 13_2_20CM_70_9]
MPEASVSEVSLGRAGRRKIFPSAHRDLLSDHGDTPSETLVRFKKSDKGRIVGEPRRHQPS